MTIKLGKNKEFEFSGPEQLIYWKPQYKAGIYAIFKKSDEAGKYNVLYIGESENLSDRGFSFHHARSCWIRKAGSESGVFVGIYLMPNSTANQRMLVEKKLIEYYEPVCNER